MKTIRLSLVSLKQSAKLRPKGYLEDVLSAPAKIEGEFVTMDGHRYTALRERYAASQPTFIQAVRGLLREMVKAKKSGFRIAHWSVFLDRSIACKQCPYSSGRWVKTCGRCGCTRAKLFLASARCPERRWRV